MRVVRPRIDNCSVCPIRDARSEARGRRGDRGRGSITVMVWLLNGLTLGGALERPLR